MHEMHKQMFGLEDKTQAQDQEIGAWAESEIPALAMFCETRELRFFITLAIPSMLVPHCLFVSPL